MSDLMSLEALCERVNAWCDAHRVVPASGQAGERMTERSVRYYRTLGLVNGPGEGGYGEKHVLQLMAVRLLQARGLPLRRIRELVYGRDVDALRTIRDRGLEEAGMAGLTRPVVAPSADELWRMVPLDDDFLLVSRRGAPVTAAQREAVLAALRSFSPPPPSQNSTHHDHNPSLRPSV
jgi:DNA-binding transcriptional MerR regulator